ncbi:MAG: serine/threonine protein kinase, partial [Myxococcales bacterium]|nr:serine/threonine protein kinase [Myxococcales bacterium]
MRTTAAADSDGDRPPAPRDEGLLRVGDVVDGRYQLHDKLGTGGTGVVWRARHLQMQGPVALKILLPRLRVREQAVGRFWREARLMGELGHPNIVRVLDVSPPDAPIPYMAMELLEGGSLYQRIEEQGRVPLDEACRLLDGVLSALVAAHRRGIVHRDIKPENLMFATVRDIISDEPRTELKVLDFGASILLAEAGADELGSLAGTPFYMSPEQASGSVALDHRSDLYSVAVVLYELLSGHHPHTGENVHGILFSIASEPATPIETHRPDLPAEVFGFFATALAQDPEHRFQTGDEMRLALRGLSSELAALDRHTQLFLEAVHDDVPVSVSRGSSGVVVRRSSGVYPRAGSGPHARAGTGSYPRTGSGVYPRAGTGSYPR